MQNTYEVQEHIIIMNLLVFQNN